MKTDSVKKPAAVPPAPEKKAPAWAFPTKSRCPRCGSIETRRTSTKDDRQYRECLKVICRFKYNVQGTAI